MTIHEWPRNLAKTAHGRPISVTCMQDAAEQGRLGEPMHLRNSASLELFGVSSFIVLIGGFLRHATLALPASLAFGLLSLAQSSAADQTLAKYQRTGSDFNLFAATQACSHALPCPA